MKKITSLLLAAILLLTCSGFSFVAFADNSVTITDSDVTLEYESVAFSPIKNEPKVTVTVSQLNPSTFVYENAELTENTDYTVSYQNNEAVGTASVSVAGIGKYTGTVSKSFEIKPCSIASTRIKIKTATKASINSKPEFDVYYDDVLLDEGVDYTCEIEDYSQVGLKNVNVIFTGIGNFTGTRNYTASVYPPAVTNIKTVSRTTSSIELSWDEIEGFDITGYKVYLCDSDGDEKDFYAAFETNSCEITDLSAGSYYYFIVKAYVKVNDSTLNGEESKVFKTCTKPAKVSINTVTKSKDKTKLIVKWSKASCTGYEIEYSADKAFKKNVKKLEVTGSSTTSKSISISKNNKTYYARVRAFRRYGKTTVWGERSVKISSNFSKKYATYSTRYVNNPKRTNNLKLACKAINGKIIAPGETFSFNGTVGKRTEAKGYKEAYVFTGPDSHQLGIGGGVCQVASTMFNAALLANFQIVERHQHAQRVTYCPLGRDAAIYWGSENFRFKNNTNYPIKIAMKCENGTLTCTYYVSYNVSPKKVNLSVSRSGKNFTLRRKVGGKVNYTAHSTY